MIDDDDSLRRVIHDLLTEIGCEVVGFAACEDVPGLRRDRAPDMILLDVTPATIARVQPQLAGLFPDAPISSLHESTVETAFALLHKAWCHLARRDAAWNRVVGSR